MTAQYPFTDMASRSQHNKRKPETSTRLNQFVHKAAQASDSNMALEPAQQDLLTAVQNCQQSCQATIMSAADERKAELTLIKHDMQLIRERTTTAEARISALEDSCHPLSQTTQELQRQVGLVANGTKK